jgi:hypothetical protein
LQSIIVTGAEVVAEGLIGHIDFDAGPSGTGRTYTGVTAGGLGAFTAVMVSAPESDPQFVISYGASTGLMALGAQLPTFPGPFATHFGIQFPDSGHEIDAGTKALILATGLHIVRQTPVHLSLKFKASFVFQYDTHFSRREREREAAQQIPAQDSQENDDCECGCNAWNITIISLILVLCFVLLILPTMLHPRRAVQ